MSLTVGQGELVRIAGPNGSGKSTLLKVAGGLESPSAGRVVVRGRRAYVPERFPPALPFDPRTYLHHLGRAHGLTTAEAARRSADWLERFGITRYADTPLSRLSKGTCQKVAVAQALLAEADVLLLDEAWTGLDQAARAMLDQAAAERAAQGGRVLFVDHDPTRLAGLTTAGYALEPTGLSPLATSPVPGAPALDTRILIEALPATGHPLPERLPGAPVVRLLSDGATRLEVSAEHSDALLRSLLGAGAHIRSLGEGGPADRQVGRQEGRQEARREHRREHRQEGQEQAEGEEQG
ncbi:ATP-binding cassette domain-containing protein [Kitasatospora sp. MMS16-BH015]|uniref:ABC transporter ATP-binding protein n=1 Tax=Kitasatospora sp. MMS16-BH015 TaxID=2018025 RepID=UPI0020C33481|nr:ATP-binding cassette domain-containing protein [Kitasatospora sp. MMS16-BH015]